ncbi:MAG: DoxX family protein [Propionibacteriales bacterium]|nr:DoxX family protein [Propionibacteriales bacterium]
MPAPTNNADSSRLADAPPLADAPEPTHAHRSADAPRRAEAPRDVATLILRLTLGVVMVAHGLQKVTTMGVIGTGAAFEEMGIPGGAFAGPLVALLELVGGVAIILGLLTPIVAGLFALNMVGAAVLVHAPNGFYVTDGGWEFVFVLAVMAAFFVVSGAGRYSLDAILMPKVLRGHRESRVATT